MKYNSLNYYKLNLINKQMGSACCGKRTTAELNRYKQSHILERKLKPLTTEYIVKPQRIREHIKPHYLIDISRISKENDPLSIINTIIQTDYYQNRVQIFNNGNQLEQYDNDEKNNWLLVLVEYGMQDVPFIPRQYQYKRIGFAINKRFNEKDEKIKFMKQQLQDRYKWRFYGLFSLQLVDLQIFFQPPSKDLPSKNHPSTGRPLFLYENEKDQAEINRFNLVIEGMLKMEEQVLKQHFKNYLEYLKGQGEIDKIRDIKDLEELLQSPQKQIKIVEFLQNNNIVRQGLDLIMETTNIGVLKNVFYIYYLLFKTIKSGYKEFLIQRRPFRNFYFKLTLDQQERKSLVGLTNQNIYIPKIITCFKQLKDLPIVENEPTQIKFIVEIPEKLASFELKYDNGFMEKDNKIILNMSHQFKVTQVNMQKKQVKLRFGVLGQELETRKHGRYIIPKSHPDPTQRKFQYRMLQVFDINKYLMIHTESQLELLMSLEMWSTWLKIHAANPQQSKRYYWAQIYQKLNNVEKAFNALQSNSNESKNRILVQKLNLYVLIQDWHQFQLLFQNQFLKDDTEIKGLLQKIDPYSQNYQKQKSLWKMQELALLAFHALYSSLQSSSVKQDSRSTEITKDTITSTSSIDCSNKVQQVLDIVNSFFKSNSYFSDIFSFSTQAIFPFSSYLHYLKDFIYNKKAKHPFEKNIYQGLHIIWLPD